MNIYVAINNRNKVATNINTGTKFYTRLPNALHRLRVNEINQVVEYELVPTGRVWDEQGHLQED